MAKRSRAVHNFERQLSNSATPIFVLDAERRVRAFNAGCETLTGWPAAEIIGQLCHYASDETAGATSLAAELCPPPEVFAGEDVTVPTYLAHRDGHAIARVLRFFPLRDADDEITGVLGLILPIQPPTAATPVSAARQLHAELAALRIALRTRFGTGTLVANSVAMRAVFAQVELAQKHAAFVLLVAETGTGKEHLARVIHFGSELKANWFVPLDCRRLGADELTGVLERLLEVHQPRSAAVSPQPGTVYLADVDFLPRDLQQRLTNAFTHADIARRPRLRLIASISGDPRAAVIEDKLREDFLALLTTQTIHVPPLRERGDDLPLLAQFFLEETNRQTGKQVGGFDEQIWPPFTQYRWPGNLDELAAVVREAHDKSVEPLIRLSDLPFRFRTALDAQSLPPVEEEPLPLDSLLTELETRLITQALARTKNNKSKAAELLGIHRARLINRIKQLGLDTVDRDDDVAP